MPRRTKKEIEAAKRKSETAHKSNLKRTYGITPEEYEEIKAEQDGVCPICLRANGRTKRLAVDHDHAMVKEGYSVRESVRGLLCGPDNRMIGRLGDDPAALRRAADYLENPPARRVL